MLELKNVKKSFGKTKVLEDINITVNEGDVIAILGPSGSGKTTLLRCIEFLERADAGVMLLDGMEYSLKKASKREVHELRKKLGFVFQSYNLFANKTALENVTEGLIVAGKMKKEEAVSIGRAALEKVGMLDRSTFYPSQLSGGQQQRVAIARALMRHPAILLADEPVASLDPVTGRQILELLRDIQRDQGLTILMNSHNLELSREFSGRLIGLRQGLVVFDDGADTPSEDILATVYGGQEQLS